MNEYRSPNNAGFEYASNGKVIISNTDISANEFHFEALGFAEGFYAFYGQFDIREYRQKIFAEK